MIVEMVIVIVLRNNDKSTITVVMLHDSRNGASHVDGMIENTVIVSVTRNNENTIILVMLLACSHVVPMLGGKKKCRSSSHFTVLAHLILED